MMKFLASTAFVLTLSVSSAQSHDYWQNGDAVPSWVKASCCGAADAHLLADDDLSLQDDGWHIKGLNTVIPTNHVLPSQDGRAWAFWNEASGPDASIYCFFYPMEF